MSNIINLYTIMGVIGLFVSMYIFLKSKKNIDEVKNKAGEIYLIYKNDEKIKIALETVSKINGEYEEFQEKKSKIKEKIDDVKNNGVNLEFEDISKYCKKKDEKEGDQFYYIPNNPYLKKFQEDILLTSSYYSDNIAFVIDEILRLLDTKGNCSSVVQTEMKEIAKTDKEKTSYKLLSQIDLAKHSVNVAMNMYKRHSDGIKMLKAVVIGLTHDLGKIPEYYKEYSGMGKHNIISTLVLNQIQHFNEIGIFEDIKEIIRQHHDTAKSDKDDIMLISLREADAEARRSEIYYIDEKSKLESLETINITQKPKEKEREKKEIDENQDAEKEKDKNQVNEPNKEVMSEDVNKDKILTDINEDNAVVNDEIKFEKKDIISFFKELLKHINTFNEENKFLAFTCPKKNIYFQPNLSIDILSNICPDKLKYIVQSNDKEKVLNSFMNAVREYYPHTKSNLVKDGFFGNFFTLYKGNKEEIYMFLMSVNASIYIEIGEQERFEEADNRKKDTLIEEILSVKVSGKKKNNITKNKDTFADQVTNCFGDNL